MKWLSFFALAALPLCASLQTPDVSQKEKPATLKILVGKDVPQVQLEVKGRYHVYNPVDSMQLSYGLNGKRQTVKLEEYGLSWGERFPGSFQIRVVPGDSQSTILVNGTQYKGCVEIYAAGKKLEIINEVDVETFLKATLPLQVSEPLSEEALNALAIVARTDAYYHALKNKKGAWDIEAKECSYQGTAFQGRNRAIDKAVDTTRHAILTYENKPFAATWTKNSAGRTASCAEIFRKALLSPPGVVVPLAAKDRNLHKWSFSLPKQTLAKAAHLKTVSSIDLYVAAPTDKVYAVRLSDAAHSSDIDFFTLQKVIGAAKLRSNDFKVELKNDLLVFTGYGEGCGVGLCLYSAEKLAEQGEAAPKILASFFPSTKLEKVRSLNLSP